MPQHPQENMQQPSGMGPEIDPEATAPTSNQTKAVVAESLSIATQASLEAVEAAGEDPNMPPETTAKIGQATILLSEAAEELTAPAVPGAGGLNPGDGKAPPMAKPDMR